ncbi:hypothetical protein EPUS_07421 [Endocarpon pusillum Z07020]|uniref:Heterokaryon incompatibility domain-containing protein n=1 Tax=Endocarpon pusillum (strain Z07020 / HMAS-L-300199) TaxID=1263415 RepID=U1GGZ6_ENDPU|nr:uncharacterized protein EPUS_07421 [Endocarpon pusillum Z07020]ERF71393.1 hypothetical protein EPUS_07421 [Endocarpon pusillum Z07020]
MASQLYKPLDTERRETRVISLLPGRWSEIVACELSVVSLDDKPEYEALSYVWGDPENTLPMLLNAHTVQVTVNLRNALRRLRRRNARIIWVDALCIHQGDLHERSQQVSIMTDIYKGAIAVQIYLGESRVLDTISEEEQATWDLVDQPPRTIWGRFNEDADAADYAKIIAFHNIQKRADGPANFGSLTEWLRQADLGAFAIMRYLADGKCFTDCLRRDAGSPIWVAALESLKHLLDSPWWRRVWTFQEAMAPQLATVIYGENEAPLDVVEDSGSVIWPLHIEGPQRCCKEFFFSLPVEQRDILMSFVTAMTDQERCHHSHYMYECPQTERLQELLQYTRGRVASDARDKVFALLGLVRHLPDPVTILPDYSMTTAQVYTRTAIELIRHANNLDILMTYEIKDIVSPIPSWVPDWSSSGNDERADVWIHSRALEFNAGPCGAGQVADLRDDRVLVINGLQVDAVSNITAPLAKESDVISTRLHEWLSALYGYYKTRGWHLDEFYPGAASLTGALTGRNSLSKGSHTVQDALWRTLIGDLMLERYSIHRRATPNDELRFSLWFKNEYSGLYDYENFYLINDVDAPTESVEEPHPEIESVLSTLRDAGHRFRVVMPRPPEPRVIKFSDYIAPIGRAFWEANDGRSFFVTSRGYMGFGPRDMREGDLLFVLVGGKVPFVLRQVSGGVEYEGFTEEEKARVYSLVGYCYVHGIMDGEAIRGHEDEVGQIFLL